jgi:hypothetical protein
MFKGVSVTQQEPNAPSAQAISHMAADVWQKLVGPEEEEAVPVSIVA